MTGDNKVAEPSKNWRLWDWTCECGQRGDAAQAKWVDTEWGTTLMLCPVCNRKVDLPGDAKRVDVRRARRLRMQGLTWQAVADELGCSRVGVHRAVRLANRARSNLHE